MEMGGVSDRWEALESSSLATRVEQRHGAVPPRTTPVATTCEFPLLLPHLSMKNPSCTHMRMSTTPGHPAGSFPETECFLQYNWHTLAPVRIRLPAHATPGIAFTTGATTTSASRLGLG